MAAGLDTQRLGAVFQSRPDILARIKKAADSPARVSLFNEIATFVLDQLSATDEPASKRRRIDSGHANGGAPSSTVDAAASSASNGAEAAASESVLLEVKDISVSIPQRKKYDLVFTKNYLYARASGSTTPVKGIVYAWKEIEYVFYLPVPEKTQLQHNYVLFPRNTCLSALRSSATSGDIEPLVFTVPSTAPKPGSISGSAASNAAAISDTYQSLFDWAITAQLRSTGNAETSIVAPDPKVFHSVIRQAHRPAERAVHVKGFRGSKDGYLFFLPSGILWGFKKPLLFMPLERIVAVSYTNVLQRTFNIVVEVDVSEGAGGGDEELVEVEFGMLDQEDYAGIDETYVKRHGLQDRSMAERRKAKRELAENARGAGKKGGADGEDQVNGHAGEDDDMTELERARLEAEQQLQYDEDEEEEDYDPGSEGESEGEGESSDDEDEEEGEGYDEEEEPEGYAEDAEE
ncbi:Histone chaperone [Pleurostoma richardsiae]|uniref:Histone chaperone n=1 Tax=Pleurostoma richardsiae TaxID=41990 RepID=A0AA38R1G8_9PEZI|nr:Histone chaperone [Pleurostoma richardsiae]